MKKNFGKFKQVRTCTEVSPSPSPDVFAFYPWTEERLGAAKGTQTTEDFRRLEQETDAKHKSLDKVWQAATIYQAQLAKKKESPEDPKIKLMPVETFGSSLISYGVAFDDESFYGMFANKNASVGQ
ncbi:hypothetical protein BC936DRAFT_136872 [Jimgerdemannia flammicorona]|uniref:Uncharacterized protein n=2 Tax=Jimgerdemannia flammicorona TaxID=994334 RepID=A0A433QEW6_9FUNG|nr:hypothetical protein BC936DRAFT_136872 [Jimgerdemannia flammicorona]RUS28360.1 hypothetical protein BC938DRAFT_481982 [Jimgerdemannia flammicorona]